MIRIRNIHIQYDKVILDSESIDILVGKITLLKGKSGIGKTALLYRVGLMSDDESFYYEYNGKEIKTKKERYEFRKNNISFVLQDIDFLPHLSVYQTIEYFAKMYQKQLTKEYIQKLLLQVRLDIDLNQNIMTLSLGEKQRLSLVCSLIKEPTFLILDEPTASLDQENEKIILDILDELSKKGITILIASHSEIVEHYAQCIYVIEDTHLIKVKDDFQEELVNVNHHNKIQRNFLKNYVFNYIKHYRFLYSFLVMILTSFLLSMNVFNIFLEYSKENSIKILEGQFNNKLVITQDEENMFLNQDYTTYMSSCSIQNAYPLYQMSVSYNEQDISIVPYFENDHFDRQLASSFDDDKDGIYMDSTTYYQYKESQTHDMEIIVQDQGQEYIVSQTFKINGVLQDSYQQHYTTESQRFIFMPYHMMTDIYEKLDASHQYVGYVVLYDSFQALEEGYKDLQNQGYHINDSFTDINSLNGLTDYYIQLQIIVSSIILFMTLIIDIILMSHIHKQTRKENMVLRLTGLSNSQIMYISLYEYLIEMIISVSIASVVSIIISIVSSKLNIQTIIIINVIYFIILLLERIFLIYRELTKYTIEKVLRESEGK